jgi:hypothetical protein
VANGPPEPALLESGENEQGVQRTTKRCLTFCTRLPKTKLFALALPGVTTCRPGCTTKSIIGASAALFVFVFVASAARPDLLTLRQRLLVLGHPAFEGGDDFQFLRLVVPSAFDRCAFVKIKLFGVIRAD